MQQTGFHISKNGIDQQGLDKAKKIYWNLRPAEIYELALTRQEGEIAAGGALLVKTGRIQAARHKINLSSAMPPPRIMFGGIIINPSAPNNLTHCTKMCLPMHKAKSFLCKIYLAALIIRIGWPPAW